MSALAKLCLNMGKTVSGSDKQRSEICTELEHLGAKVFYKHNAKNIDGANLLVYTCAVGENNEEVLKAKSLNIPVMERAEFLGEICKCYNNVIAVAGSHGKTTVCGMLFNIFNCSGKQPTLLVGGEMNVGNLVIGKTDFLIVEACEYREHFLKLNPTASVILNIDYDHPDYYKKNIDYENAFVKFSKLAKKSVIVDEKYNILLQEDVENAFKSKVITFGYNGTYQVKHISYAESGITFDVYKNNRFFVNIELNLIGMHNVLNSLCAVAVADSFGIEKSHIKQGLKDYDGVKRRYEYMGKLKNNIVIADYAHHPTQVKNAIVATKDVYSKKITAVFEPHTYSRTKAFLTDFANALALANSIIILPTYSAREKSKRGGTSRDLFETTKKLAKNVSFVKSYKKCKKELLKLDNNIILLLGAGSIYKLAEEIKHDFLSKNDELKE